MCRHLDTLLESIPTTEGEVTEGSKKVFIAFSKDMSNMENKIKMIREELQTFKQEVKQEMNLVKNQVSNVEVQVSNVEGKVDSILELIKSRVNSPVDEERLTGAMVNRILKSRKLWIGLVIIMFLLVLSGISISYFLDRANEVAILADSVAKFK